MLFLKTFSKLSSVKIHNITNNLQLFNASSQRMEIDGVISPKINLTNGQITQLDYVIVSPDRGVPPLYGRHGETSTFT